MAMTAKGTVAGPNGQIIQKQVKNKDLHIPESELEAYIDDLIEAQGAICAFSGFRYSSTAPRMTTEHRLH